MHARSATLLTAFVCLRLLASPEPAAAQATATFTDYLTRFPYKTPHSEALKAAARAAAIRSSFALLAKGTETTLDDVKSRLRQMVETDLGPCPAPCRGYQVELEEVGVQRVLGKRVRVYAAYAREPDADCHACSVKLSLFEVTDDAGRHELASNALNLGEFGAWGAPPELAFTAIAADRYAVAVKQGYMAQGHLIESLILLVPMAGTYFEVLDAVTGESHDGSLSIPAWKSSLTFVPGGGPFFNIVMRKLVGRRSSETILFEFDERAGVYRPKAAPKR